MCHRGQECETLLPPWTARVLPLPTLPAIPKTATVDGWCPHPRSQPHFKLPPWTVCVPTPCPGQRQNCNHGRLVSSPLPSQGFFELPPWTARILTHDPFRLTSKLPQWTARILTPPSGHRQKLPPWSFVSSLTPYSPTLKMPQSSRPTFKIATMDGSCPHTAFPANAKAAAMNGSWPPTHPPRQILKLPSWRARVLIPPRGQRKACSCPHTPSRPTLKLPPLTVRVLTPLCFANDSYWKQPQFSL